MLGAGCWMLEAVGRQNATDAPFVVVLAMDALWFHWWRPIAPCAGGVISSATCRLCLSASLPICHCAGFWCNRVDICVAACFCAGLRLELAPARRDECSALLCHSSSILLCSALLCPALPWRWLCVCVPYIGTPRPAGCHHTTDPRPTAKCCRITQPSLAAYGCLFALSIISSSRASNRLSSGPLRAWPPVVARHTNRGNAGGVANSSKVAVAVTEPRHPSPAAT